MTDSTVTTCYRHPDRITRLSCTTCGKPICVECSRDASVGQKCPECALPERGARVVNARMTTGRPTYRTSPASFAIIAITVLIYAVSALSPEADKWLIEQFALVTEPIIVAASGGLPAVLVPEPYKIFTVALLHAGPMHLLFNMYALYLFGPRLEQQVGSAAFTALYIATAGVGGATSYLLSTGPLYAVGASGAIFGLFGAWLFVAWRMRNTPGGRALFNQLGFLLAINLALPLFIPNIDWRAHLGGFAAGILIAWLWSMFAVGRTNARGVRTVIASLVALAALVATILF